MVSFPIYYTREWGGGGALTFKILQEVSKMALTFEGRLLLRLTRLFTRYVVNCCISNLYCLPPSPQEELYMYSGSYRYRHACFLTILRGNSILVLAQ